MSIPRSSTSSQMRYSPVCCRPSLVRSVFRHLATFDHLRHHGWPYIDPRFLDLRALRIDTESWPKDPKNSTDPYLTHLASLRYYYGPAVQELVRQYFTDSRERTSQTALQDWFVRFFREIYQWEMTENITRLVKAHLTSLRSKWTISALETTADEECLHQAAVQGVETALKNPPLNTSKAYTKAQHLWADFWPSLTVTM